MVINDLTPKPGQQMSMSVGGLLEAGGVNCRKLVVGELDFGEKMAEVVNVVNGLVEKVAKLEKELDELKVEVKDLKKRMGRSKSHKSG